MKVLHLITGAVVRPGSPVPEAVVVSMNLLNEGLTVPEGGAQRIIAWSGWTGEGDPTRSHFEREVRTWGPGAWAGLGAACDRLLPELSARGMELCLRPHARHVLSDPQRCLAFLRGRAGQPVRLLLEPAAFLTGSMLGQAEDHLERAMAALGGHPGVWAVLLTNLARSPGEDEDLLRPVPLGAGLIDPGIVVAAWRRHCPTGLPCVILDRDAAAQMELLDRA